MKLLKRAVILILYFVLFLTLSANAAHYTYDDLGRLISVTYEDGQVISYTYDAGGNILSVMGVDSDQPVISDFVPVDGSVYQEVILIGAMITDNESINTDSIVMKLNGNIVGHHYEEISDKAGRVFYNPAESLPAESYTVNLSVSDIAGNQAVATWSFTVASSLEILEISPEPGTTISLQRPVINVDIISFASLTPDNITFKVDGQKVFPELAVVGLNLYRITYQPEHEWPEEELITLYLSITDNDTVISKNWSYFINTRGEMAGTFQDISTCILCHDGVTIKQQLCGQCHESSIIPWQGMCFECHLTGSPPSAHHQYHIYPHDIISIHEISPQDMIGCRVCHSAILTREHNRNNYTCATCHSHESTDIINAIQNSQRACFSCHTGAAASFVHREHSVKLDSTCVVCHSDNMVTEKVQHDKDCAGCHLNTNPIVRSAIYRQKDSCFDCHTQAHGVYMTNYREDIPLYPDVAWTIPDAAAVWEDEGWLHEVFKNGGSKIIFSARKTFITNDVYYYYQTEMDAWGWELLSDSYIISQSHFELLYKKGRRFCGGH